MARADRRYVGADFPAYGLSCWSAAGLASFFPACFHRASAALRQSRALLSTNWQAHFFWCAMHCSVLNNGFDERFFMYFEEVDFSLRAKSLGFSSYFLADASAVHLGAGSSNSVKAQRLFYSLRSRMQYVEKHFSKPRFFAVLLLTVAIEPFTRLSWSCWRDSFIRLRNTLSAYRAFYGWLLRTCIIGRSRAQCAALGHHRWKFFS